jgi:hypothetical protein
VGIIGVTAPAAWLGDGHLTFIVGAHIGVLALGALALLLRRAVSAPGDEPVRTGADVPMLGMAAITVLAAGYGVACGNAHHAVLVAAYELAVIPAYFFMATHTLTSPHRLRAAEILYVVCAAGLAASGFAVPGRHGGLLSVLVLLPLLVSASRLRGWQRAGVVVSIAGFTMDVTLAAYRAMWLAAGLALLIVCFRAAVTVRRTAAAVAFTGALLTLSAVVFSAGVRARTALVGQELHQPAGYRLSEATVGMNVFAHRPLLGAGLGQTVPRVYLPGFAVTTVGPTYHVFYVTILANLGLLGLVATLWPILRTLRVGLASQNGHAVAFSCLTCGFLAAAAFAGPSDGHWDLGLLPALTLLSARADTARADTPGTAAHKLEGVR